MPQLTYASAGTPANAGAHPNRGAARRHAPLTRIARVAAPSPYERLEAALADVEPPFAVVDLDAFRANAADLARRAGGKPIRVASKSVRCVRLQREALALPGFRGSMTFTLRESLWLLAQGFDDLLLGYPTVDRAALAELGERAPVLMIDCVEHLDLIDAAAPAAARPVRVCLDFDASLELRRRPRADRPEALAAAHARATSRRSPGRSSRAPASSSPA